MSVVALRRATVALFLIGILGVVALGQQQTSIVDLVRRSGFIFQGTVKTVGTATSTVVAEPNTAIVSVDRVLESVPPPDNPKGRDVTVRFRKGHVMRPGQRATFFTYVYGGGTSLALDEVAILPLQDPQALQNRIRAARQTLADEALAKRIASAELIVIGTVGEAKPTDDARDPRSEHDPLWWQAPLRVESVEKGAASSNAEVVVNIAMNYDYLWALAPKPKAGETGIFLLQPDREKRFRVSGFFLLNPLDLLPRKELDRVRRLIKSHP